MSVAEISLRADSFKHAQMPVSPRTRPRARIDASAPGLRAADGDDLPEEAVSLLFDVGGTIFPIERHLIERWPTSLLAELLMKFDKGELAGTRLDGFMQDPPQPMFLDRHPTAFSGIAKFYRSKGEVLEHPWTISKDAWNSELRFFRLIGLGPTVDAAEAASMVIKQLGRPRLGHRRLMWDFLEDPSSSCAAQGFMVFGVAVIVTSIISMSLDTVYIKPSDQELFANLEMSCILFFTAEYLVRMYATDGKMRFIKGRLNAIDLVAILPFYVGLLLPGGVDGLSVVRVVRLVRVFRVFKLGASMRGLTVFKNTMVNSFDALLLLLFFVMLAVLLFGAVIFFAERDDNRFDFPGADGNPLPRFCDHMSWEGCAECTGPGAEMPVCGGRQTDIVDALYTGTHPATQTSCEATAGCVFIPAVESSCTAQFLGSVPNDDTTVTDCEAHFADFEGPRSACVHGCNFVEASPAACISAFEQHFFSEVYTPTEEACSGDSDDGRSGSCSARYVGLKGEKSCVDLGLSCTYTAAQDPAEPLALLQAHQTHGAQCPTGASFTAPRPSPWSVAGGYGAPIFTSIPVGFWWTICTMTSLGYGEIYPVTHIGRIVGGLASLAGLITLALPMVIIGQNFSDAYRVQSIVEEAQADAKEALTARREARAKMMFDEKFRKLKGETFAHFCPCPLCFRLIFGRFAQPVAGA